jgi:phenylpropionate dioxygenase-like ring-hydroxylating dioxygenase large terminal subunit
VRGGTETVPHPGDPIDEHRGVDVAIESIRTNELDVAGEAALYGTMRRFWHPVMYGRDLVDEPRQAFLLGEQLVLVRFSDGIRVFRDICVHRGTALSLGWIDDDKLVCAYHGWTYGPDGRCVRIPARHGDTIPSRARLTGFPAEERDGLIWVCLEPEPLMPPPSFPEFSDPAYRVVAGPVYDWACSAPRRLENFVDFAHFAWVHEGILGTRDHPEVPEHDVWRAGPELRFACRVAEPTTGITKHQLGVEDELLEVENTYRLFLPSTIYLHRRFPGDNHYILFMSASPVGPKRTRSFWYIARNYALDDPDEEFVRFEELILQQDRPVVESQRPEELPVDLSAELHIKGVDRVSLEYRKWLVEIVRNLQSNPQWRPSLEWPDGRPDRGR